MAEVGNLRRLPQRLQTPRLVLPLGPSIIQWCTQPFLSAACSCFTADGLARCKDVPTPPHVAFHTWKVSIPRLALSVQCQQTFRSVDPIPPTPESGRAAPQMQCTNALRKQHPKGAQHERPYPNDYGHTRTRAFLARPQMPQGIQVPYPRSCAVQDVRSLGIQPMG